MSGRISCSKCGANFDTNEISDYFRRVCPSCREPVLRVAGFRWKLRTDPNWSEDFGSFEWETTDGESLWIVAHGLEGRWILVGLHGFDRTGAHLSETEEALDSPFSAMRRARELVNAQREAERRLEAELGEEGVG